MPTLQSLLAQAAVIRDATAEGENTANRVGSMFVSLIEAVIATLPAELLDASGISMTAGESNVVIRFNSLASDGTASSRQVSIPAASVVGAGLLTPSKLAEINKATADVATALAEIAEAAEAAETARQRADSAYQLAEEAKSEAEAKTFQHVRDVVMFDGSPQSRVELATGAAPGGSVAWWSASNRFVCRHDGKYYTDWPTARDFGEPASDGVRPISSKIYINSADNMPYVWNGSGLVRVGHRPWQTVAGESEFEAMKASGSINNDTLYLILGEE